MTSKLPNLWPEDLGAAPADELPVVILREQATMLGERTKNLVEAEVRTEPTTELARRSINIRLDRDIPPWERPGTNITFEPEMVHHFVLKAPAISDYRYGLFGVYQPASIYPVAILFEQQTYLAGSKEEFIEHLREIFSAEITRKIVSALIAQRAV
ncbi:hypothetical protein BE04_41660 [Sorangium cellulosum]|uniref:Uncharacterized protein n=2 Tax=Sorangium cellulosum TaxID=56 RepID=A0A150PN49_SORCE|nr:hypothetical protein [Sorangium cellulosum]AGP34358.1 hypothetical protein SCE1572_07465 [Sorangium cellulosum So0157-2]KYF57109.1 hypothetical protein BE04_41660 [Sorangium cellulosum]